MCQYILQHVMVYASYELCLEIRILSTAYSAYYEMKIYFEDREYSKIVFRLRVVYPVVSSRTLPARMRHDPTS